MTGQQILDRAIAFLRRYVVLTDAQALALAVWCLHTRVYERLSRTTAYVEVTGVSGSGKTTLMEVSALLCRGADMVNTIRSLSMCRYIEERHGEATIFVDEAERLASNAYGDQRSMLASGYRRGGLHRISVGDSSKAYSSWCPKMFTSLRTITPVLHNRSIPIWLDKGKPVAALALEYERAEADAAQLVEAFARYMASVPRIVTEQADWFTDARDQEIWTPLVSLARTLDVSRSCYDALVTASVDLQAKRGIERRADIKVEDENAQERSYALRLIQDVQACVRDGETAIRSSDLVTRLYALPTGPWRSFQQSGLTEITLAQLLGAIGPTSVDIQLGHGRKDRVRCKGYRVADLRKATRT